jgi:hypothetical protein
MNHFDLTPEESRQIAVAAEPAAQTVLTLIAFITAHDQALPEQLQRTISDTAIEIGKWAVYAMDQIDSNRAHAARATLDRLEVGLRDYINDINKDR